MSMFKIWTYYKIPCIYPCMPGILTFDWTPDAVWCVWTNGISDHSPICHLAFVNSFASHLLSAEVHQDEEFAPSSSRQLLGDVFFFHPIASSGWKDDISSELAFKWWQRSPIARQYSITQTFRTVSVELLPSHSQEFCGNPPKTPSLVLSRLLWFLVLASSKKDV